MPRRRRRRRRRPPSKLAVFSTLMSRLWWPLKRLPSMKTPHELLHLQARGQRLLQLFSLLLVRDLQCVEESGTPHLELVVISVLLDLDTLSVLPPGFQEEVLDLLDLPGHPH